MKLFRWDESTNEWLKLNRDVCFEQIVVLMEQSNLLDVIDNPNQGKYLNLGGRYEKDNS